MGRGGGKKEREGHRYTAIGRKSNEDENRGKGQKRHKQEENRGRRLVDRKVFTLEKA